MLLTFPARAKKLLTRFSRQLGWRDGDGNSRRAQPGSSYLLQWIDTAGATHTEEVTLSGVSPRVTRVWCDVGLMPGVRASLSGAVPVRGVVTACTRKQDSYLIELLCAVDRRKSRRRLVSGVAKIDWWSDTDGPVQLPAEVENVSGVGARIRTSRSVPAQEIIRLSGKNLECVSIVRHCTMEAGHYVLGLQFIEEPHVRSSR